MKQWARIALIRPTVDDVVGVGVGEENVLYTLRGEFRHLPLEVELGGRHAVQLRRLDIHAFLGGGLGENPCELPELSDV